MKSLKALSSLLLAVGILLSGYRPIAAVETIAMTDSGPVEGIAKDDKTNTVVFKGIPFAAPPVGPNRWRDPQPVKPWHETRYCKEFGPCCPQSDALERIYGIKLPPLSEDCLYLNVFTPGIHQSQLLPVMVWIHGGGFSTGNSANYNGENLASLGAVIVTINYRVGIFGFFTHPALSREDPHGASGNYGLRDIIAALHWVKHNISNFGGSPDNVTIFGQSAGGTAVCDLMASPLAKGLFHRAIAQSNGAYYLWPDLKTSEELGNKFSKALGTNSADDVLEAMRKKSWEDLMATGTSTKIRFNQIIDGYVLLTNPVVTFKAGTQHNVPFIVGSNSDESDRGFTICARVFGRLHCKVNPNTFRYLFSKASPDPRWAGKGAVHAAELPFMFNGGTLAVKYFDEPDKVLAGMMSSMWVQFARTGNPNLPDSSIEWPKYDTIDEPYIEFGDEIRIGNRLKVDICEKMEMTFDQKLAEWLKKQNP